MGALRPRTVVLGVLAASLLACQPASRLAPEPPKATRATRVVDAALAAQLRREGGSRVGAEGASLLGLDGATVIRVPPSGLVRVAPKGQLIGVDGGTLIGVDGGTLIGVDGGTLIGVDGGTLIGVDGGTLIGVDGGTLIGVDGGTLTGRVELPAGLVGPRTGYRLASTAPAANVRAYVRDARGRFFVGPDGRLVSAVTNQDGVVTFQGYRAARGLSLHVPLDATDGVLRGFSGLRPRNQPANVPVSITPTATLLAGWVETQVLASQPDPAAALDRLTPEAARQADEACRAALSAEALAGSAWRPDRLAAAASAAGEKHKALAAALQEVRRVMTLAGVDACAPGGLARQTPLLLPIAVAATKAGDIFVASGSVGGITRIAAADGRVSFNAGACVRLGTDEVTTPPFEQLVAADDGWLYAGSRNGRGVWRLQPPDGTPEQWLGDGEVVAAPGVARRDVKLHAVTDVAAAPDGGLWVSDQPKQAAPGARLLHVDASGSVVGVWRNGRVAAMEGGGALLPEGRLVALAAGPDGTLWGLQKSATLTLWKKKPGDEAFMSLEVDTLKDLDFRYCRLLAMPDGSVLLSASDSGRSRSHKVLRIGPDGSVATYAGVGPIGYDTEPPTLAAAHFNRPSGMALDAQGRVLVADYGNAQVRRIDSQQNRVEAIAGGRDTNEVVALQAGLNLPVGVAFTREGQLLVTEVGGNALRRLEGDTLRRIAGGMAGVAGAGGPAQADRLGNPTALACTGDHAFLVELFGPRLRRLDLRTNLIETLTGTHINTASHALQPDARPGDVAWTSIAALTLDAKGRPIFAAVAPSAPSRGMIWRLEDGNLTRLVGSERNDAPPAADGAGALDATLGLVTGLTYDARGNLYFAEATQGIVWRLDPAGTLHKVAGRGQVETLLRIVDGQAAAEADVPREEATLLMPIGLAADPAGNVYVAELGTRGLAVFADSMEIDLGAVLGEGVQVPELRGRLRKLTPEGRAITLAGTGSPAAPGGVMNPVSVAVDPKTGRVVFVDFGTGQVKELVGGQAQGR